MAVAKRQRRENRTKEGPRTREPQVKQTALLASPIYIEQAGGGVGGRADIKIGAKNGPEASLLFSSRLLGWPALRP